MIKRTYIGDTSVETSLENLAEYLQKVTVLKYFSKIEIDNSLISCFVDDFCIMTIGSPATVGVTVKTKNNTSINISTGTTSYTKFSYAYECNCGVALKMNGSSVFGLAITKDESENTTIIMENKLYCVSSASNPAPIYAMNANSDEISPIRIVRCETPSFAKTTLAPFVVSGGDGNYTPNVLLQLFEHNTEQGVLDIDGVKYFSNGLWCVKDE